MLETETDTQRHFTEPALFPPSPTPTPLPCICLFLLSLVFDDLILGFVPAILLLLSSWGSRVILEAHPALHPSSSLSGAFLNDHSFRITWLLLHKTLALCSLELCFDLKLPFACRLPSLYFMRTPIPSSGALAFSVCLGTQS